MWEYYCGWTMCDSLHTISNGVLSVNLTTFPKWNLNEWNFIFMVVVAIESNNDYQEACYCSICIENKIFIVLCVRVGDQISNSIPKWIHISISQMIHKNGDFWHSSMLYCHLCNCIEYCMLVHSIDEWALQKLLDWNYSSDVSNW